MQNNIQLYLDKIISGECDLSLPILSDDGISVGVLRPLSVLHLESDDIIQKLTDWRNKNKKSFLTEFDATQDRTKNWLANIVFKTPGQLLFLMYENGEIVGHLGFKNLNNDEALLDNAIKGVQTSDAKIMVRAHKVIADWLFEITNISRLCGYVLTDNIPAIMMNREIGFTGWERFPLLMEESNGNINWIFGREGTVSPNNKYCYKILLYKNSK